MKIILLTFGLYLGSGVISNLLTAENIFMGIQQRQIDSAILLRLVLTILAFWMSFKFKNIGV